jgi:hypothetical protein
MYALNYRHRLAGWVVDYIPDRAYHAAKLAALHYRMGLYGEMVDPKSVSLVKINERPIVEDDDRR